MDQEIKDKLQVARKDLGIGGYKLAPDSYQVPIDTIIDAALEPFISTHLFPAEHRLDKFMLPFEEVVKRIRAKRKFVTARHFAIAYITGRFIEELDDVALRSLAPPNLSVPGFVMFMDLSHGASLVTTSLKMGMNDSHALIVADKTVSGLRGEDQLPLSIPKLSFQIPEFVLAGADFANRLSKAINPIAVELLSQSSG